MRAHQGMWLLGSLLLLGLLAAGFLVYLTQIGNPRVANELRNDPSGDTARRVMLLTISDEKVIPVNYLREGNQVYAGSDFGWWRAFRAEGAPVRVLIRGEELSGHARAVLDDPDFKRDVFSRLRPTVPAWLPEWLRGKLVVITLDD